MTRDPKRVRKGFRNGSKTVPKRFPNRFGTVFEPFSNRFGTFPKPFPFRNRCRLVQASLGEPFSTCVPTPSRLKGFQDFLSTRFRRVFRPAAVLGPSSRPLFDPLNRLSKNVSSPAMHVHTPMPLFYKKELGEREPIPLKNYRYITWPHGAASTSHFKEGCCARWCLGTREKKRVSKRVRNSIFQKKGGERFTEKT